jgi:hypothetical protein
VSRERPDNVLSERGIERQQQTGATARQEVAAQAAEAAAARPDPDAEAEAFIRFCYRRRSVTWPELYDEMCAVAARGEYRGMDYEQLRRLGIGFALPALPRLAELAARVIAQERSRPPIAAVA